MRKGSSMLARRRSIALGLMIVFFASILAMGSVPATAASESFTATKRTTSFYSKMEPQLQVVGDNIYYVWYEYDGSNYYQIWTASMKTDGTGWSAVQRTTSAYHKEEPQLQVVGDNIYYVWRERPQGISISQIWTASMKTDGTGWSAVQRATSAYQEGPQLQVVGDTIYYVWYEYDGSYWQIWTASMKTDGTGWSATKRTTSAYKYKFDPQLQVVGDTIHYVFKVKENDGGSYWQIWTASMNTDGTGWSAVQHTIPYTNGMFSTQLQVVGDTIHYVWDGYDGSNINGPYQIWTASMKTDGTGWSAVQRTTSSYNNWWPQLQVVGDIIHYVWDGCGGSIYQIWTASMNTDGTGWSAVQHTTFSHEKREPQLQVVGDNTYYVWREYDDGRDQIWTAVLNLPDNIPPPAPSLVSPDNEAVTTDNTPTFVWTSVSDPSGVTYQIQVDDNDDFSSPVYSAIDLTENWHTLLDEDALPMFIQFFWHVRAVDGVSNVGNWSDTWDLTVVPMGAIGVLLMPLLMLLPFALMLRRQNRRYHY